MAAPTTITESGLKTYLHGVLATSMSSNILAWSVAGGSYDSIVEDALLEYPLEDIAEITVMSGVRLMRACGRLAMWRKMVATTMGFHDANNYELTAKYFQINAHARQAMLDEEALVKELREEIESGGMRGVRIYSVERTTDPLTASRCTTCGELPEDCECEYT